MVKIPEQKLLKITDVALRVFARNGYSKASISDIASMSGVSKSMIFHYFGTKKQLYIYLAESTVSLATTRMQAAVSQAKTPDFFQRMTIFARAKADIMRGRTAVLNFLMSMYYETADEVAAEIQQYFVRGRHVFDNLMQGIDWSRFKEGVDPQLLYKSIVWIAEGMGARCLLDQNCDFDALTDEYISILNMLKLHYYKQ